MSTLRPRVATVSMSSTNLFEHPTQAALDRTPVRAPSRTGRPQALVLRRSFTM